MGTIHPFIKPVDQTTSPREVLFNKLMDCADKAPNLKNAAFLRHKARQAMYLPTAQVWPQHEWRLHV